MTTLNHSYRKKKMDVEMIMEKDGIDKIVETTVLKVLKRNYPLDIYLFIERNVIVKRFYRVLLEMNTTVFKRNIFDRGLKPYTVERARWLVIGGEDDGETLHMNFDGKLVLGKRSRVPAALVYGEVETRYITPNGNIHLHCRGTRYFGREDAEFI
jgi:hypothetical protein